MGLCFGFAVADVVALSDEICVVGFKPLRIAVPGEEVWVCEDGGQKVEIGLYAGDGCVLDGTLSFADNIVPSTSSNNDLCDDTVEVRTHAGRNTMNKCGVDPNAVTRREMEGLNLADAKRVILLWVFCCQTKLN